MNHSNSEEINTIKSNKSKEDTSFTIEYNEEYLLNQSKVNISNNSSLNKKKQESESIIIGDYLIKKTLGEGNFGKVELGVYIPTKEKVAIKIIEKKKIKKNEDLMRVKREFDMESKFNNINVILIREIFETQYNYYIIMEYCEKGDLFDYILKNGKLSEKEASFYFYQLINGLEYIHSLGIVHRDLKPENILLTSNYLIKIIDFGLSNYFNENNNILLTSRCGSIFYASPEVIVGNNYNGFKIDIWSVGIILYFMICGYLPFEDSKTEILFKKILRCKVEFPNFISDSVKELIEKILVVEPEKRININDIKKHPFFYQGKKIFYSVIYDQNIPIYLIDKETLNIKVEKHNLEYNSYLDNDNKDKNKFWYNKIDYQLKNENKEKVILDNKNIIYYNNNENKSIYQKNEKEEERKKYCKKIKNERNNKEKKNLNIYKHIIKNNNNKKETMVITNMDNKINKYKKLINLPSKANDSSKEKKIIEVTGPNNINKRKKIIKLKINNPHYKINNSFDTIENNKNKKIEKITQVNSSNKIQNIIKKNILKNQKSKDISKNSKKVINDNNLNNNIIKIKIDNYFQRNNPNINNKYYLTKSLNSYFINSEGKKINNSNKKKSNKIFPLKINKSLEQLDFQLVNQKTKRNVVKKINKINISNLFRNMFIFNNRLNKIKNHSQSFKKTKRRFNEKSIIDLVDSKVDLPNYKQKIINSDNLSNEYKSHKPFDNLSKDKFNDGSSKKKKNIKIYKIYKIFKDSSTLFVNKINKKIKGKAINKSNNFNLNNNNFNKESNPFMKTNSYTKNNFKKEKKIKYLKTEFNIQKKDSIKKNNILSFKQLSYYQNSKINLKDSINRNKINENLISKDFNKSKYDIKTFKRKEIYNIINNYYNNNNKNKKINISPLSQKNNIINIERKKTSLNNKEGCILKNLIKKYKNSYNIQNNTIDNLGRSNVVHNMINNEEDINKTPKYEKKRCRINKNIKKDIFSKEIEKEKNKNTKIFSK